MFLLVSVSLSLQVGGIVELMRVVDYAFGVNIAVHCYFATRSLRISGEENSASASSFSASSSVETSSLSREGDKIVEVDDLFPLFLFEDDDDDDDDEPKDSRKRSEGENYRLSSLLGRFDLKRRTRKISSRSRFQRTARTTGCGTGGEKSEGDGETGGAEELLKEETRDHLGKGGREGDEHQKDICHSPEERREKFVEWIKSMMNELDKVPMDQLAIVKDLASKSLQCALAYCDKITSWKRCLNSPVSQYMQKYVLLFLPRLPSLACSSCLVEY